MRPSDFDEITLHLNSGNSEIELRFSDDYQPVSVTAQRWDAKYNTGTQDITDVIDIGEPVEINGSKILVSDDGNDYIYEVYATWAQGSSYYVFRTEGTR